jgi:excisionase family DNA binding protein
VIVRGAPASRANAAIPERAGRGVHLLGSGPSPDHSVTELSSSRRSAPTSSPLLTLIEAAEYLRVSVPTVERLIHRKLITSVKIGGARRVVRAKLDEFIERNQQGGVRRSS